MALLYNRSSALPQKVLLPASRTLWESMGPAVAFSPLILALNLSLSFNLALLSRLSATRRSYNIDILFEYLSSIYPRKRYTIDGRFYLRLSSQ